MGIPSVERVVPRPEIFLIVLGSLGFASNILEMVMVTYCLEYRNIQVFHGCLHVFPYLRGIEDNIPEGNTVHRDLRIEISLGSLLYVRHRL